MTSATLRIRKSRLMLGLWSDCADGRPGLRGDRERAPGAERRGTMGVSLFRNQTLPARVLPVLWAVLYVYGRLVGHFGKPEKFYGS